MSITTLHTSHCLLPVFINETMYRPDGILNMYKNVKTKNKIPYTLATYFLVLQLFLGLDYGFGSILKPKLRPIVKCATIAVTITIACTPLIMEFIIFDNFNILMAAQYLVNICILQTSKYTLYDMIVSINSIVGLKETRYECVGLAVSVYGIFFYATKLVSHVIHCLVSETEIICKNGWMTYFMFATLVLGIEMVPLALIVMFYHIYCAVKHLNTLSMNAKPLSNYITVADSYSKIMPLYDKLITVELLFEIPKMLGLMWKVLVLAKAKAGWFAYVSECVNTFFIALQICLPAAVAEMINHQLEAVKLKLLNRLVTEEGDQSNDEISLMIQYIEMRLQHKTWRVIPMDLRLPISLASFCVTYFVVIIQFTHLYD